MQNVWKQNICSSKSIILYKFKRFSYYNRPAMFMFIPWTWFNRNNNRGLYPLCSPPYLSIPLNPFFKFVVFILFSQGGKYSFLPRIFGYSSPSDVAIEGKPGYAYSRPGAFPKYSIFLSFSSFWLSMQVCRSSFGAALNLVHHSLDHLNVITAIFLGSRLSQAGVPCGFSFREIH